MTLEAMEMEIANEHPLKENEKSEQIHRLKMLQLLKEMHPLTKNNRRWMERGQVNIIIEMRISIGEETEFGGKVGLTTPSAIISNLKCHK